MCKTVFKLLLAMLLGFAVFLTPATAKEKAWLGVQVKALTQSAATADGVLVVAVADGSPAERMGVRQGDIIISVNEKKLTSFAELVNAVAALSPGNIISLLIVRDGQKMSLSGNLGTLPSVASVKQPVKRTDSTTQKTSVEIFAQLGHSGVQSIVVSSDGKYVLSGGDKTVKLWDITTGREIRTYAGHMSFVSSAALSPDGRYILAGDMGRIIVLREVSTGKVVRRFTGHTSGVFSVAFSPDGRSALSGSMDKSIKLWDVATGREIRSFTGHQEAVRSVGFSPNGKLILSGSWDKTLRLWDVETGKEIRTFTGHSNSINSVAFSPDGRYVLSGSGDNTISGRGDNTLRLWDVATGKEIRTFTGHSKNVNSVAFSPDGKHVLSGSWDKTLRLWDIETGKEIKTFTGHSTSVFSVAFSPDGKHVLSGGNNLKVWDIYTGKEVRALEGKVNWVFSVAFSPDGKYAVSGNANGTANLWEVATGKQIRAFQEHTGSITSLTFSPNGKLILAARYNGPLKLWDVETGREVNQLAGQASAVFSPDGKLILSGGANNSLKLWNAETGTELKAFSGHTDRIASVVFSPDGKYALSGSRDKTLKLWEISSGREIQTFRGHKYHVTSVAFSPDGRYALSASRDNTIKLWDVETGREVRTWQDSSVNSVVFSPDGRYALSGGFDNSPKLWHISSGETIRSFKGHTLSIRSVAFSPNGKYILSGSRDGTVRIWDARSGKEIVQFIGFTDGEWIVITPEGYYNSSLNGHKQLNIRMGNNVYGIDQFYDVFYRPDIVTAKLRGEDISSLVTLTIDDAIKNPPPTVEFTSIPSASDRAKVKVCYKVKSTGGGIGEVRLFHNGKLIESDGYYKDMAKTSVMKTQLAALNSEAIYEDMRSIAIKGKTSATVVNKVKGDIYEGCVEVEAVPGENEVSVTAFNKSNTVQSYMKTTSFDSKVKYDEPHLYILSIGIDRYKDSRVDLKYAAKDAKDIARKLLEQSTTLYRPQNIHHELLTDANATKTGILNRINKFADKIKPADGFILFVAGHGVLLQNQYFMLTHDYNGDISDDRLISSNELVEISKKIKSLNQLFIFDTCHAGGVDYIVSGLYDARMSVLAKKMGLHIYTSASSMQEAMDGYRGNGLFTHTLLDGLANKREADKNNDNKISVVELGGYSKSSTAEISKKLGHSQTPLIINFGRDNPVYGLR